MDGGVSRGGRCERDLWLQSGSVVQGAGRAARTPDRAVPRQFLWLAQPGSSWNNILPCPRRAELKVHYVLLLETLFFF